MKNMTPFKERNISAQEYLRQIQSRTICSNIESIRFVPPKIGGNGFGKFRVEYKIPVLTEE